MLLMIDNYDSFTWNLVQYLAEMGEEVRVIRNDEWTVDEIAAARPDRIVISPGPCTPNEAGVSLAVIERLAGKVPILGVCLGHQSIGQAFGGRVVRAKTIMHGKTSAIHHAGAGVFAGLPNPSRPRATTRWWWSATRCPTASRSRPGPRGRTASMRSWASGTAGIRSRACSSTPSRS